MLYFDYNPKEITENELTIKNRELLDNSTFVHGDTVKLKGDTNSPIMAVTAVNIETINFQYQKHSRSQVTTTCSWYNKSRQEFSNQKFSGLCLEKI